MGRDGRLHQRPSQMASDHLRWHRKPSEMASDGQLAHLCIPNSPLRVLGKVGACLVLEVYEGLSRSRLGSICFFQARSYIMLSTRTSPYKKVNKAKTNFHLCLSSPSGPKLKKCRDCVPSCDKERAQFVAHSLSNLLKLSAVYPSILLHMNITARWGRRAFVGLPCPLCSMTAAFFGARQLLASGQNRLRRRSIYTN